MSGMTAANPLNGNPMRLVEVRTLKPTHGTGLHSVTPAHCIEDLKLSYMFNLKRDGILCSKTGAINTGPLSGIQNQDTVALQSYFGSHPSFFANWKHQCPSFTTKDSELVTMLTIDGWFMKISDKLKFKCFNELATVKFVPSLKLQHEQKSTDKPEDTQQYLSVAEELDDFSEWCISDQGHWGVPVPYFIDNKSAQILSDPEVTRHIANIFREQGSDAWFKLSVEQLLPAQYKDRAPGL